MRTVQVKASQNYSVVIGDRLSEKAGEWIRTVIKPCRAAIITDSTVDRLYGDCIEKSLVNAGFSTLRFAMPAGETNKNISVLSDILEFMAEGQMTRSDVVVALGGGIPGDVAGFAASVYARGIPFVQIPTTLLAAVDSSVGGKTAIDLKAGKNLAGAFHQPSLVITDTAVIRQLPPPLLSDGAAEIIKCGVLRDPKLFGWMCQKDWLDRIDEIIERSVSIKAEIVSADEFDTGLRRQLNLGHTFAHAIEKCSDYTFSHGQAVAVGMMYAAGAANLPSICKDIAQANRNCGLPTSTPYSAQQLAAAALSDKKRMGSRITMVLPDRIGNCYLEEVKITELEEIFRRGILLAGAYT